MKLERIDIRAARSYDKTTGYLGEITFDGPFGKVLIRTDDELSRAILSVCADKIVAASRQVAEQLTANIIEQVSAPALEAPAKLDS